MWLFRGGSAKKMQALKMPAPWVPAQLERLDAPHEARAISSKVLGFRLMHLQGRALAELIPRMVDDLAAYDYYDGEIISGLVLGWNFGDGHLNRGC